MFLGRHAHTIDPKGRLSIPAAMRNELQQPGQAAPILTHLGRCLKFYPYEVWQATAERLRSRPFPRPDVQAFQRLFLSSSEQCPIDAQGRILVPPFLREKAKLQREVTIIGYGDHIEIWDRERFREEESRSEARFDEIESEVSKVEW